MTLLNLERYLHTVSTNLFCIAKFVQNRFVWNGINYCKYTKIRTILITNISEKFIKFKQETYITVNNYFLFYYLSRHKNSAMSLVICNSNLCLRWQLITQYLQRINLKKKEKGKICILKLSYIPLKIIFKVFFFELLHNKNNVRYLSLYSVSHIYILYFFKRCC